MLRLSLLLPMLASCEPPLAAQCDSDDQSLLQGQSSVRVAKQNTVEKDEAYTTMQNTMARPQGAGPLAWRAGSSDNWFYSPDVETECAQHRMTSGTCRWFGCYSWRGETECVNGRCVCAEGKCSGFGPGRHPRRGVCVSPQTWAQTHESTETYSGPRPSWANNGNDDNNGNNDTPNNGDNLLRSSVNAQVWAELYDLGTPRSDSQPSAMRATFDTSLQDLDVSALTADIRTVMFNNRQFWPADFGGVQDGAFAGEGGSDGENGNYGPLFVRLAWHCAGTFRMTDGKGGCTGGRQRFEPERSWEDNTNLDKARALLAPIKIKYGDALSWGDLIIAAGTTALREMGTPVRQFCLGRVDEPDGTNSLPLGIGGQPESSDPPCEVQGMCEEPLGAGTVGLIYVNPEGPVLEAGGSPVPDPVAAAANIRDVFGRMGQDDRETVALIGGGHSVGKSHGACDIPHAQGLSPFEAYEQDQSFAWAGECGPGSGLQGQGPNVVTSGIEGDWTTRPTYWDNEFFTNLVDREWELFTGPGGKYQWRLVDATADEANLMRMTTDIALINDDRYRAIVEEFARDSTAFDEAFDDAWFKLTHRGGSWSPQSKCDVGSMPAWVREAEYNVMLDSDY